MLGASPREIHMADDVPKYDFTGGGDRVRVAEQRFGDAFPESVERSHDDSPYCATRRREVPASLKG